MSAFMVEDRVINSVVWSLVDFREFGWALRELAEAGWDVSSDAGRMALADDMFKLNIRAIDARYGDGEAAKFRPLDFKAGPVVPSSPVRCYKSLQCFLYQCAEGDIPDNSVLYAVLDRLASRLAEYIVSRLKEYDEADWG